MRRLTFLLASSILGPLAGHKPHSAAALASLRRGWNAGYRRTGDMDKMDFMIEGDASSPIALRLWRLASKYLRFFTISLALTASIGRAGPEKVWLKHSSNNLERRSLAL